MRAIKFTVFTMGALLGVGLIVIVVTLINRASQLGDETSPVSGPATVRETLTLAAGDRIANATLDGFRALLVIDRAAGHQDVMVLDARTGTVLLDLSGAPAPAAIPEIEAEPDTAQNQ